MRILIRFGDNDFYSTNMAFLRVLRDYAISSRKKNDIKNVLTKEHIVQVYNEIAYGLYLLNQNQWKYSSSGGNHKEYLKITEDRVHLNNEIDEWAKKDWAMNGDWFYLDIDNDQMECW